MTRTLRLLLASTLIVTSTACFEIERHVSLNADGSAMVHDRFAISDSLMAIFKQMNELDPSESLTDDAPEFADQATLDGLAANGISITRFDKQFDLDRFFFDLEVKLDSFAAVAHSAPLVPLEEGESSEPLPLTLTQTEPGVYKLTLKAEKPPTNKAVDEGEAEGKPIDAKAAMAPNPAPPLADPPAEPESEPEPEPESEPESELSQEDQEKMLELTLSMMDTVKDLKLEQSITVPGKIVDYGPASGKKKGKTVSWTQDAKTLQTAMESGTIDDGTRWVSFTKVTLPEDALYAP